MCENCESPNLSNIEMLTELMEYANTGAMMQLFVIDSCTKMAEAVTKDPEGFKKQMGEKPFVHPDAWIATAQEFLDTMKKHETTGIPRRTFDKECGCFCP